MPDPHCPHLPPPWLLGTPTLPSASVNLPVPGTPQQWAHRVPVLWGLAHFIQPDVLKVPALMARVASASF